MIQFGTSDEYLKVCDALSKNGSDARVYQTAELAIYDVIHSLIHFMPHKSKIAVVAQGTHLVEIVTSIALKNQNQIVYKKPHENIMSFLETLDSHTHFVFWSNEHEITGQVFYSEKQGEEILSVLNRKKIFSVKVTHNSTITMAFVPDVVSFSVVLIAPTVFNSQLENSVIYYSDKQKIPFGLAAIQNNFILNRPTASGTGNDRVVVPLREVSALAVKEYLNLSDQEAFVASMFPTWVTDKWVTWWPETAQLHFLEHLLILSSKFINENTDYIEKIHLAEEKIKSMSHWKI